MGALFRAPLPAAQQAEAPVAGADRAGMRKEVVRTKEKVGELENKGGQVSDLVVLSRVN